VRGELRKGGRSRGEGEEELHLHTKVYGGVGGEEGDTSVCAYGVVGIAEHNEGKDLT
jgi:hypothetical protein